MGVLCEKKRKNKTKKIKNKTYFLVLKRQILKKANKACTTPHARHTSTQI